MKIGILTMELHENRQPNTVGSSRIRGTWLARAWSEAEIFRIGQAYDVVVYQKAYHLEHMKHFEGVKILDLCDPDWLEGKPVIEAIGHCDAVTTSTEALAEYLRELTEKPVVCVPDRIDLAEHQGRKVHQGKARGVVWFGYSSNQKVIDQCLTTLKRLGLQLTVLSDLPYAPEAGVQGIDESWVADNVRNIRYDYPSFAQELVANGDIVINPRLESGRFKFKSNNKSLTSWALGMPVAQDADDLERFMDETARKDEAAARYAEILKDWNVTASVEQYKTIVQDVLAKRAAV